jgi:KDO2-lipid IV(A) lauroyltransferase
MTDEKSKGSSGKKPRARPQWMHVEARFMEASVARLEKASWASCRRTGAWLGIAFHNALAARRHIATENVRLAFPGVGEREAAHIARRASQNMFMTMCESLHMGAASAAEIREYSPAHGFEYLHAAREAGKGVVTLTGHFGNWEMLGARVAQEVPLTVLARPNSNQGIEKHIAQMRGNAGIGVISKWETARAALRVLRDGEVLGLLPDQRAGASEGILLPMFGHRTRFYTSVAQFAMMTGAPIVPTFGVRRTPWLQDGRIDSTCFAPLPFREMPHVSNVEEKRAAREKAVLLITQDVIRALEDAIRRNPDQWWWIHRRWRGGECDTLPEWAHAVGKTRVKTRPRKRKMKPVSTRTP